jgi:hypothetical protein
MKNSPKIVLVFFAILSTLSSFTILLSSGQPPQGYTGADGFYCTQCHSTNPLNNAGGSVTANGLPTNGYTPGTAYAFSISTTHSAVDRRRWGFSIVARNSQNQTVGTFSENSANAGINGNELSHFPAFATAALSNYTFSNLTWTAPATPTIDDQNITFYFTGNAANGSGTSGDYIYAATATSALVSNTQTYTFTGSGNWGDAANWSNNMVPPATISGSNAEIIIDPIANGECVLNTVQTVQNNAKFLVKEGKKFRVIGDLRIIN